MQTLPPLSAEERAHSGRLIDAIRNEIDAAGGWISFERYMEMSLYQPGLGYYSAGTHKLGAGGDFTTAPEISPLFAFCLGSQCAEVLRQLGGGALFELGAGSGTMAADLLSELARLGCLPDCYLILEVSADLRARQQATLRRRVPQFLERVQWLQQLPESFHGVLVANEVLDALPVQRFAIEQGKVHALGVTWRDDRFVWASMPAAPMLEGAVRKLEQDLSRAFPESYISEINTRLQPWLAAFAAVLDRGVMLWVDYGLPCGEYYSTERREGTLLCHYRHRYHDDPFANVGVQDITAWVDFTAVAEAALSCGMDVMGFATQAHFLLGAGIDRRLEDLAHADTQTRALLTQQAQELVLPGEMGERFKVLGLAKEFEGRLSGFGFRDLRDRL